MDKAKKILVYWDITDAQKEQIRKIAEPAGYQIVFTTDMSLAEHEACDAEILFGAEIGPLKRARNAKWFCSHWAGVNAFLAPGVLPNDEMILSNSSGAYGVTIAEHIIMVTLMLMRKYYDYDKIMRTTDWSNHSIPMHSICGSRITVLGTGDIGTVFAARAKAFQPSCIVGVNRSGRKPSADYDRIITQDHLADILPETDLLVMSLPGTPETDNIMSAEMLALLPENAYLVNVGRGNAIDEGALVQMLNTEKLAGAALDVMRTEPLPADSPLRSAKNIILTPHTAGQMTLAHTRQKAVDLFCEDLENYIEGRPLKREVKREIGY